MLNSRLFAAISLMAAFVCPAADAAEPEKYHVYTFQQPAGFDTLEAFVKANYEGALDATTLTPTTVDGQSAISFWTDAGGIREFNLLIQGDTKWILMTSAQLDFTQDDPSVPSGTLGRDAPQTDKVAGSLRAMSTVIASSVLSSPCMIPANAGNCVLFVRCLAPWLPHVDLTTIAEKIILINSSVPKIGAVAVIRVTGTFQVNGHMAYVIAVNYGSGGKVTTVSILESHYAYANGFDIRTDTPSNLNIAGYVTH
jgi:hypothetical protein